MRTADEVVAQANIGCSGRGAARPESAHALAWIMAFYIVVAVGRIEDLFGPLQQVHFAKIVAAAAVLAALHQRGALSNLKVLSLRPAKLMVLFMGLVAISILFSVLRSGTLGVIEGTAISVVIGTALVVKAARSWRDVRTMMLGCVGSALVLVIMAMTTGINGRSGLSSAYDPNDFAFVLVTLLPIVLTYYAISRGVIRFGYLGLAAWVVLTILETQSRGGLLGLLAVALIMAIVLPKNRRGVLEVRPTAPRTVARLFAIVVCGVVAWGLLSQAARTRLSTITDLSQDYNANAAANGRLTIWLETLPLIASRPWGYGAGAFDTVDGLFAHGRYRAPHNMFLQGLIELGVEGFALFIAVLASAIRYLSYTSNAHAEPASRDEIERSVFARAIIAAIVGACVSGFFLSELYAQTLWILIALACVVGKAPPMPRPAPYPRAG